MGKGEIDDYYANDPNAQSGDSYIDELGSQAEKIKRKMKKKEFIRSSMMPCCIKYKAKVANLFFVRLTFSELHHNDLYTRHGIQLRDPFSFDYID